MIKNVLTLLAGVLLFTGIKAQTNPDPFANVFINALKSGTFKTLEKHMPTKALYKLMDKSAAKRTDKQIDESLKNLRQKLKNGFDKILETAKNKPVTLSSVKPVETLMHEPYPAANVDGMFIIYEYQGYNWDDLFIITKKHNNVTYLIDIPNPTRVFAMTDSTLSQSAEARAKIRLKDPQALEWLKNHVEKLTKWAQDGDMDHFAEFVVYRGEDEKRKWKSGVELSNEIEKQAVEAFMARIKKEFSNCTKGVFGKARSDRESEGIWIVQEVICGNRTINFAFLQIGDKLMIGDLDVED